MIYGGDGLARLPVDPSNPAPVPVATNSVTANPAAANKDQHARGKAVFIPFVLAQEKIEAAITGQKASFARGQIKQVIEPSPHRIEPQCRYFARCGGCHYQHASYEHQLEIKQQILRENLLRTAKLELECELQVHASPPWNYRNRSRLQVGTQPQFAAGYFKTSSHELLPVEECPISSPLINRGIAVLWQLGRAQKVPNGVREVEFFANADDTELLVAFWCEAPTRRAEVRNLAEELKEIFSPIAGITAFRESQTKGKRGGSQPVAPETLLTFGEQHLTYQTALNSYRVSAGGFFQVNRHLIDQLVNIVSKGRSGDRALDLYAGAGLFSTALACDFRHIVSVESSHLSFYDLKYNLPSQGKAVLATSESYVTSLPNPERPDLIVVDPPRSGLGEHVAQSIVKMDAARITYVSCDPATLARDLISFLAAGYRVEQAHLVDLFPQTYHLETVLQLTR
jgi:23S rRNA (uracil1939-C5)-methyltransferase